MMTATPRSLPLGGVLALCMSLACASEPAGSTGVLSDSVSSTQSGESASSSSGTQSSTDAGSGEASDTGDDSTATGALLDVGASESGMSSAGDTGSGGAPWLLSMARLEEDGDVHLVHINIDNAATQSVCVLVDAVTQLPIEGIGPSLTFTRDDRLIASFGDRLSEILLPSCEVVELGAIGYAEVYGILPDEGNDLYGISSTSDVLLHIDSQTGTGTVVGSLGQDWFLAGATWIESSQDIIGLRGTDTGLYDIDQSTGIGSLISLLSVQFTKIGIEHHPLTNQLYACSGDRHLYRIEADYSVTDIGEMGIANECTNLGAPWSEVMLPID